MKKISYLLLALVFMFCASSLSVAQDKSEKNAKTDSAKTSLKYAGEGSAYFLKGDFRNAIKPYQKSLDLEKNQPTLEKNIWRVVVDNLGMSYGITGDLKKAKETFEYGLSKDPDYAMFHYNMACTYAEMKDEEQAIVFLRSAFKNKENMIKGEQMPDPSTDDSFARFMKDEKFLKVLEEIEQQ